MTTEEKRSWGPGDTRKLYPLRITKRVGGSGDATVEIRIEDFDTRPEAEARKLELETLGYGVERKYR